jgi:hypothetical protein
MKYSITTIAGLSGAIALSVSQVPNLPTWLHTACIVTVAASVALVGYHAQDRSGKPPATPAATLAIIGAALALSLTGCKVGGLGVQVSSPAFGSVGVTLDGGLIGHGKLSTNATGAATAPR